MDDRYRFKPIILQQYFDSDRIDLTQYFFELDNRDRRIIEYYFGLNGKREHTLEEIGRIFGISRERVRQLRNRGLYKISKLIEEENKWIGV